MGHANLIILEQNAVVFRCRSSFAACKTQDIRLAHGDTTDVWVEHTIIVNDACKCFHISSIPGLRLYASIIDMNHPNGSLLLTQTDGRFSSRFSFADQ